MSEREESHAAQPANPDRWVDEHGDYLYRYALARVGRSDVAEDLVQDTLLAALRAAAQYAGRSSERTWLTGILKNKLIDRLRRSQPVHTVADLSQADDWLDSLYDRTGHWKAAPGRWGGDPAEL